MGGTVRVPQEHIHHHISNSYVLRIVGIGVLIGIIVGGAGVWFAMRNSDQSSAAAPVAHTVTNVRREAPQALAAPIAMSCQAGSYFARLSTAAPGPYAMYNASVKFAEIKSRMGYDHVDLMTPVQLGYSAVRNACPSVVH